MIVAVLCCGVTRFASAGIVFEVHIGGRPPEANQVLQPLLDELERRGMTALPASVHARLGDHLIRSGIADPTLNIVTVINRVDTARRLLKKGKCQAADRQFADAIDRSYENLAMLVNNRADSQKALMDALEGHAVCLDRLEKHQESLLAWEELVRSYPNQESAIRGRYGKEAYESYQDAQQRLMDKGSGTLIIEVDDRTALIFCDEWDHPQTAVFQSSVLPGTYRVLALSPGTAGRWYAVSVKPGERVHLKLNSALDATLTVSDIFAGFVFASQHDASRLIEYARQVLGPDERVLITVSFTDLGGRRAPIGTLYRLDTGARLRAYAAPLTGIDDERRLRSLARKLVDPSAIAPDVVDLLRPPVGLDRPAAREAPTVPSYTLPRWMPSWIPGVTMGTGSLAIIGGAVAYSHTSYDQQHPRSDGTDGKNPSVGVMLGGSLVLGGGVYLWNRESFRGNRLAAGLLGVGVASVAAGLEFYLVAQEPLPTAPKYIRDTATKGIVLGSAGLAVAGAGVWLLQRDRPATATAEANGGGRAPSRRAWAPYVFAGSAQTLLGCAGSF
jgi:tetratricopeptide (TPR) repeat protein